MSEQVALNQMPAKTKETLQSIASRLYIKRTAI